MATTRLRKTFKYPSDSEDSDVSRDEMDEQGEPPPGFGGRSSDNRLGRANISIPEQESLIAKLRESEAKQNAQYNLIFAILPLTIIPLFLIYLPSSSPSAALLCLLAITSLISTSYTMRYLQMASNSPARSNPLGLEVDGPIERYLPYMNGGIVCLLLFASWSLKGRQESQEGFWIFLLLPAIMLAMVLVARKSMADVEAELTGLDKMKYNYKGA